jgi:hypothetical protein
LKRRRRRRRRRRALEGQVQLIQGSANLHVFSTTDLNIK